MKRFTKIFVNLLAVSMLFATCLGLFGCNNAEKIKVELQLSVYNYQEEKFYDAEDTVLTIELYRHLAPTTVDKMVEYIKDGYYNDVIFYGYEGNKIMFGDLKMNDSGEIYQNDIKPQIEGEFANGGTIGSDLMVEKGNIALWRTWFAGDGYTVSKNQDTGRATWFMPTTDISSYNDYFCVFAVIDMKNEINANTWEYINSAINSNSETYEVYYTGTYDESKADQNNGLIFNCEMGEATVDEDEIFSPEGDQFACYAKHDIKIAKGTSSIPCGAKIVSAKIV